MSSIRSALPVVLAFAAAGAAAPVAAETVTCTEIASLPATISTQGVYCMKKNFVLNLASGSAVTVTVNNVTLDCNEFKIGNLLAGPSTQAVGVSASGRLNVRVRGCGIRGFRAGVSLSDGLYAVEDNRFDHNGEVAAAVSGDGSLVRGNEVLDTGGGTAAGITAAYGLWVEGDVDVIDNTVSQVVSAAGSDGDVHGIYATANDAGTIAGNRVRNLAPDGAGLRRGIWATLSNRITVERNTVVLDGSELIEGEGGIRCGDAALLMNGASRDNTVLGVGAGGEALGLINCAAAGGDFTNPL